MPLISFTLPKPRHLPKFFSMGGDSANPKTPAPRTGVVTIGKFSDGEGEQRLTRGYGSYYHFTMSPQAKAKDRVLRQGKIMSDKQGGLLYQLQDGPDLPPDTLAKLAEILPIEERSKKITVKDTRTPTPTP